MKERFVSHLILTWSKYMYTYIHVCLCIYECRHIHIQVIPLDKPIGSVPGKLSVWQLPPSMHLFLALYVRGATQFVGDVLMEMVKKDM